jgi:hypothetical protein
VAAVVVQELLMIDGACAPLRTPRFYLVMYLDEKKSSMVVEVGGGGGKRDGCLGASFGVRHICSASRGEEQTAIKSQSGVVLLRRPPIHMGCLHNTRYTM